MNTEMEITQVFKFAVAAVAAMTSMAAAQVGESFAVPVTLESNGQSVIVGLYDFNGDSIIDAVTVNGSAISNEVAFRRHGLATDIQREAWDTFQGAVSRAEIVIPPSMYDDPWAVPAGGPSLIPDLFNNPAYLDETDCKSEVMQDFYERAHFIFEGGGEPPVLPLGDCVDLFFPEDCFVEAQDYWFVDENNVPWSIEDWPHGIEEELDFMPDGECGLVEKRYTVVKCVSAFIPVERPNPLTLPGQLTDKQKEWWKRVDNVPGTTEKYFPVKWRNITWNFDPRLPRPGFLVECDGANRPKPVVLAPENRPGPVSDIAPIFIFPEGVWESPTQDLTDCIQDGLGIVPDMWKHWELNPGEVLEEIDETPFEFGAPRWKRLLEYDDAIRQLLEECLPVGHH